MASHAEAEKELQSQIESLHDQLQATQAEADRKQAMVDSLSEVGVVLDVSDFAEKTRLMIYSERGSIIADRTRFLGGRYAEEYMLQSTYRKYLEAL